jgi:hypothetical protein
MAIDLSGGLDDELELVFATRPDDPDMRESVNAWIWDDGDLGLPRIGVEAVADQWDTHDVQVNLALADGRVVGCFEPGAVHHPAGSDGRPRILGAGPLAFEAVEPFGLLRVRFDGTASLSSVDEQLAGVFPGQGEPIGLQIEIDLRPAAPPWMNGALLAEAKRVLDTQDEGDLMGHPWRFEQLCRATGRVRVGDEELTIDGGANRVRRQSIRRLARFRGHAWQAALFPSGRGFAYIAYPPREDGRPTYNEGYLFDGDGELIPARVTDAPWLREVAAGPSDVTCTLETEDGRTETIVGETAISTFMVMPPDVGGGMQLQQAIVRYSWDGERSSGMVERSTPPGQMT